MVFSDEPMEDLTALAVRLSQSVGEARGVLILSRDGLVLGACPADAEGSLKVPWLRFASLGEPERGFVQFGGEIWSYVRRGAYAGFVVTGIGVRPGFVLDQIEIALLHAEEARARREGLRAETAPPPVAPSGKPRTPLHPEARPEPPVVIRTEAVSPATPPPAPPPAAPPTPAAPGARTLAPQSAGARADVEEVAPPADVTSAGRPPAEPQPAAEPPRTEAPAAEAPRSAPSGTETPGSEAPEAAPEEEATEEEIDRFSLAREFSQLLQERDEGADG